MDLVYVSYNSAKWIPKCFESVICSSYNLKDLYIYVLDNNSSDDTVEKLNHCKELYGSRLGGFEVISSKKNYGFGKGNNIAFEKGNSDIVCFFNIDTELLPDTLTNLETAIDRSASNVVMWELRQFPYEHPKLYNPITLEAEWSSGAAFAIRREIFSSLNGFDEKIFMYAEDVDLSFRVRSYGYKIQYVPKAIINHYSYQSAGEVKPNQYVNSIINNLYLRYRYGGRHAILVGHKLFWKTVIHANDAFPGAKRVLLKKYFQHFILFPHFWSKKNLGSEIPRLGLRFEGFDYTRNREGAFYINSLPAESPLVSILVRTCGRPNVLRETLCSLRNQTYNNIEIVVVEDGLPVSQQMINEEFNDLNILYHATGVKVGRSKAGNIAMELSNGKYLNFLDDDDVFFADHVEVLVSSLERSNSRAAYAFALATPIEIKSLNPYRYEIKDYQSIHNQEFGRLELYYHNCLPIQSIMFEKALYFENGGLDESLDALEDWDLWVRYSLNSTFTCVKKTTSAYRVPFDTKVNTKRQAELDQALPIVREKLKKYKPVLSAYDYALFFEGRM